MLRDEVKAQSTEMERLVDKCQKMERDVSMKKFTIEAMKKKSEEMMQVSGQ